MGLRSILLHFAFAAALLTAPLAQAAETLDETPRIAVISAFPPEWAPVHYWDTDIR